MKLTKLFTSFFESEKSSGILLLFCTILSLFLTNLFLKEEYMHFWHLEIYGCKIETIINDGLMTIFFLMIGLELEREIYIGELSSFKNAALPILAALGGMLFPAFIYLIITNNSGFEKGFGIPMATDIAFAITILSLVGNKAPNSLKIFLTALAVIDDLGAILVIAIFYSKEINWVYLGIASIIFGILLIMNKAKFHKLWPYLILGFILWFCMLKSGIHATISGVLLAFAIPFQNGEEKSISYQLEKKLHNPVAFLILPLFTLANTAILFHFDNSSSFPIYAIGIFLGLLIGKPLGIFAFSWSAVYLKIAKLPEDLNWKIILGAGILGGIGFTMSIFISLLAFDNNEIINDSKFYIILSSVIAGASGFFFLKKTLQSETNP